MPLPSVHRKTDVVTATELVVTSLVLVFGFIWFDSKRRGF